MLGPFLLSVLFLPLQSVFSWELFFFFGALPLAHHTFSFYLSISWSPSIIYASILGPVVASLTLLLLLFPQWDISSLISSFLSYKSQQLLPKSSGSSQVKPLLCVHLTLATLQKDHPTTIFLFTHTCYLLYFSFFFSGKYSTGQNLLEKIECS